MTRKLGDYLPLCQSFVERHLIFACSTQFMGPITFAMITAIHFNPVLNLIILDLAFSGFLDPAHLQMWWNLIFLINTCAFNNISLMWNPAPHQEGFATQQNAQILSTLPLLWLLTIATHISQTFRIKILLNSKKKTTVLRSQLAGYEQ